MKKYQVLSLLPLFLLPSCKNEGKDANLFLYTDNDSFINSLVSSINDSFLQKGISLRKYVASRKQSLQNNQFVNLLDENEHKPILLNIYDRLSASVLIEKAQKEDTPLLFFNREPLLQDMESNDWVKENVYYVGAYAEYQGVAQAEIAADYFKDASSFKGSKFDKNNDGKLQVAILRGELSHQDALNRSKYSIEKLRQLGFDVDLIEVAYCDWEEGKGYDETGKMILKGDNIELLLSNNDAMAVGAIRYLKSLMNPDVSFLEQFFPIVGVDGTTEGKKAVEDGYMLGTVLNDASTQAQILFSLYTSLVDGLEMPTFDDEIIVKGNFYKVKGMKITNKIN